LWTGDADSRLCIITVEDGRRTSAFLTRAWFPRTIHFNYAIHAAFLRMVLLTDIYRNVTSLRSNDLWYREKTALYVPLLLCTAFSQLSDFNHFTPLTERGSSYEEKYLTEDEISAELLADTLSDVPEDADSDSENDSKSSIIGNRQNKIVRPLPSTTRVIGEYFLKISVHKNS